MKSFQSPRLRPCDKQNQYIYACNINLGRNELYKSWWNLHEISGIKGVQNAWQGLNIW